jgi:two-component system, cell cycle sensor histidine kinase and response regulator CckA
VKAATAAASLGYVLVTVVGEFTRGNTTFDLLMQGGTALVCAIAYLLASRDRIGWAASLTIGAVWIELSSALHLTGLDAAPMVVFPALIVTTGLLLGGPAAYLLAAATSLSTLGLGVVAHQALTVTPGPMGEAVYRWLEFTVVLVVTATLVHAAMKSLGSVVRASRAGAQRLYNLVEHSPDGILALDDAGVVLSANPAAARILGQGAFNLVERPAGAAFLDWGFDDSALEPLARLLDNPSGRVVTLEGRGEDGQLRALEVSATRFRGAHGADRVQLTLHDVTERVQAEEVARGVRARMEESNRLESVGRLAGGIAHDFNNHLTVIGGSAELLLSRDVEDPRGLARDILEAKMRASALTKALVAFARKTIISPRALDPSALLHDLAPLLESLAGDEIRIEVDTEETPPILVDRVQLEQVLINLVSNAKDALGGTGTISILTVRPGGRRACPAGQGQPVPDGFVEIRVTDRGTGMDEETRARAFEPFYTDAAFGERTGLGLATVHGIVTQNRGEVVLDSRLGEGTCVHVYWPVAEAG